LFAAGSLSRFTKSYHQEEPAGQIPGASLHTVGLKAGTIKPQACYLDGCVGFSGWEIADPARIPQQGAAFRPCHRYRRTNFVRSALLPAHLFFARHKQKWSIDGFIGAR
jgi:hypothetical protein